MATNTLQLNAASSDDIFKLEGDMGANIALTATPDNTFNISFFTRDAGTFPITASLNGAALQIRKLDGTLVTTLSVGGLRGLNFTLRYNTKDTVLEIVENNLVALQAANATTGGSTGGTGGTTPGTGTGTGWSGEKQLFAVNGEVTINANDGNSFYVLLDANVKLLNPVGYVPGNKISIVFRQDTTGGRVLGYGTQYGFADSQPAPVATGIGALSKLEMRLTAGGEWMCEMSPDKTITAGYGLVTPLCRIKGNSTLFYQVRDAIPAMVDGDILYIQRNGKGPEVTGTFGTAGTYTIAGLPVGDITLSDRRPTLLALPDTRLAYQKAIINCENGTIYIRDLKVSGARNVDATSRGIAPNGPASVHMSNVEINNCENGMLWGADFSGDLTINDCMFDANGQAGQAHAIGYTHNIYAGDRNKPWYINRSTSKNSRYGHNLKNRGYIVMRQVWTENAFEAREMDTPNGGGIDAENCVFIKPDGATQNNLIGIGQEGVITTRTRSYTMKNCRLENYISAGGRDVTFIWNFDTVPINLIDCDFRGDYAISRNGNYEEGGVTWPMVRGVRGAANFIESTPGATKGPLLPVGYFPIAMTPAT